MDLKKHYYKSKHVGSSVGYGGRSVTEIRLFEDYMVVTLPVGLYIGKDSIYYKDIISCKCKQGFIAKIFNLGRLEIYSENTAVKKCKTVFVTNIKEALSIQKFIIAIIGS